MNFVKNKPSILEIEKRQCEEHDFYYKSRKKGGKMKKRLALALSIVMSVGLLGGCGSSASTTLF